MNLDVEEVSSIVGATGGIGREGEEEMVNENQWMEKVVLVKKEPKNDEMEAPEKAEKEIGEIYEHNEFGIDEEEEQNDAKQEIEEEEDESDAENEEEPETLDERMEKRRSR